MIDDFFIEFNQALSLEFCSRVFHNANGLIIYVDIFSQKLNQRPKKYKLQSKLILFSRTSSTNSKAFSDQLFVSHHQLIMLRTYFSSKVMG